MTAISVPRIRPAVRSDDGVRAPRPLLAAGLAIAAIALLPLVYLVIRALGAPPSTIDVVLRPRTAQVILGTLALGGLVGAGTLALGVPVAWLTTRTDLPWRRAWLVLTVVPLALPSYVVGFAFLAFFGPTGTLQAVLAPFGVERLPSIGGLFGAALVLTLVSFPYVTLATRAALLRMDPAVEESARLLGDGRIAVFRRVTLPVLRPAMAAGALLAVLYALSDFGAVALLQFDSLSRAIYLQLGASFDRSLAAVLALILVALTVAITWGEGRLRRRSGAFASRSGRRAPTTVELGRWRWPAIAFLGAIVSLALVVPIGTIAWWLVRGVGQGEPLRIVLDIALATFGLGAVAAIAAVVLAVPIALLAARFPSRTSRAIESASFAGYALPGIVVALAMVFLATRSLPVLYQTLALLVIVYAVRFMPQAIGGLRATLGMAGIRMEEAGRTLGDGPIGAFARITVPAVRPALVAGAALVFLTVVKELPLALLLAPIGFETLATEIWDAAASGFYARAAGPAALLIVVSAATVGILLRAEDQAR